MSDNLLIHFIDCEAPSHHHCPLYFWHVEKTVYWCCFLSVWISPSPSHTVHSVLNILSKKCFTNFRASQKRLMRASQQVCSPSQPSCPRHSSHFLFLPTESSLLFLTSLSDLFLWQPGWVIKLKKSQHMMNELNELLNELRDGWMNPLITQWKNEWQNKSTTNKMKKICQLSI